MTKTAILKIDRLPDLSMSRYQRLYGQDAVDTARQVLARVPDLLQPGADEWVGLRFQYNPRKSQRPDRLKLFMSVPTTKRACSGAIAFAGSHLINAFYRYEVLAGAKAIQPAKLPDWHILSVSKAEEAELRSDEVLGQKRFYYAPLPVEEHGPSTPPLGLDDLFDSLLAPCIVQITVRPLSLATTTFRNDVVDEIQELDRWASGSAADRITSGTLESLSSDRDILAARSRGFYKRYFDTMSSGRVYEFVMLVASTNKAEADLLARAFGEDCFGGGRYFVENDPAKTSRVSEAVKALRGFLHVVAKHSSGGEDYWSSRLAKRAGELRPVIGQRLSRLARLSHLSQMVTRETAARMLQLPASQGIPPQTIRIETEASKLPSSSGSPAVALGTCLERGGSIEFPLDELTRHAFISGMTGGGKTESMMNILIQLWRDHRIPWLLVEPAKGEYRKLCAVRSGLADDLRVYTVGSHRVSPLCLNPFEVPEEVTVDEHISTLDQCFVGAFGLGGPLLYLLPKAIHRCYEEAGYGLDDEGGPGKHWPTMCDLARTTRLVVEDAAYGGELDGIYKAALKTRIESLCQRGIGRVLASRRSIPSIEDLMSWPTIIEMLHVTQEQASLLSLFLITRARQWMARCGPRAHAQAGTKLRHLLCIEEAHNLVGSDDLQAARASGDADPQRHATQLVARVLREVRALGEGVVICSQSPASVNVEVMRQTNLKLAHYAQDRDDRDAIASATMMGPWEHEDMARLAPGEAFVYYNGLHRLRRMVGGYLTKGLQRPIDAELRAILLGKPWFKLQQLQRLGDHLHALLEQVRRVAIAGIEAAGAGDLAGAQTMAKSVQQDLREAKRQIRKALKAAQDNGAPAGPLGKVVRELGRKYEDIAGDVTRRLHAAQATAIDDNGPRAKTRRPRSKKNDTHQQVRVPREKRGKKEGDRRPTGGASGDQP